MDDSDLNGSWPNRGTVDLNKGLIRLGHHAVNRRQLDQSAMFGRLEHCQIHREIATEICHASRVRRETGEPVHSGTAVSRNYVSDLRKKGIRRAITISKTCRSLRTLVSAWHMERPHSANSTSPLWLKRSFASFVSPLSTPRLSDGTTSTLTANRRVERWLCWARMPGWSKAI